jgi:hypothetical protein
MNSRLSKSLKAEFHEKIKASLPIFKKTGTNFGGVVYRETDSERDRYLFVFLYPHSKMDSFTIEFAANAKPEYPFELLPGERTPQAGPRCRIGKFLGGKMDHWWHLNRSHELEPDITKHLGDRADIKSALSKIPSAVTDAVEKTALVLPQFIKFLD